MSDFLRDEMRVLMGTPEFRRFLFRLIERSGLLSAASNGADGRDLSMAEGRRGFMLDILAECEAAHAVQHPSGWPLMALIQTLRDEVQTPQRNLEKPHRGRRSRNDHYRELDAGDGDE